MVVLYKLMMRSCLNTTCILCQHIFLIHSTVNKDREKGSKDDEEYGKTFPGERE